MDKLEREGYGLVVMCLFVKLTESILLVFVKLKQTRIILGRMKLSHYFDLYTTVKDIFSVNN